LGYRLPLLYVRKEIFEWLKQGKKTIDVRKGKGRRGEFAVFQCGQNILRLKIVKRDFGKLGDVVRLDNYLQIIPTAVTVEDAIDYFQRLYAVCDGFFTAYHIQPSETFAEKDL
jgi:ASC-1-like (ASCH) protein